jgi:hypothetical protein
MIVTILAAILVVAAIATGYGFFKANFPVYLAGAAMIFFSGLMVLNEGIALGVIQTFNIPGEQPITVVPQVLLAATDNTAFMIGNGLFYIGVFLLAVAVIVAILNLYMRTK